MTHVKVINEHLAAIYYDGKLGDFIPRTFYPSMCGDWIELRHDAITREYLIKPKEFDGSQCSPQIEFTNTESLILELVKIFSGGTTGETTYSPARVQAYYQLVTDVLNWTKTP